MRFIKQIAIIFSVIVLLIDVSMAEPVYVNKRLLDDFSTGTFDSQKWETLIGNKELFISHGKLVGTFDGNTRASGYDYLNLPFVNPESVYAIKATVSILSTSSSFNLNPKVQLGGHFYSDSHGNVWCEIAIRNSGNGLEAWWTIHSNGSGKGLAGGTLTSNLQYNTEYTLSLNYDESANLFTFSIDGVSETSPGIDRQGPPESPWKTIDIGACCGAPRDGPASITASIDNVFINNEATPYDDFNSTDLDLSKWNTNSYKTTTNIEKGQLKFSTEASDRRTTHYIRPMISNSHYFEMKLTVQDDSYASNGAYGMARIGTYLYNDTYSSESNNESPAGDVWADMRIELYDTDTLAARVTVWRTGAPDSSSGTVLLDETFNTLIQKDVPTNLSMEFTGAQILFECNGETIFFPILSPVYDLENRTQSYIFVGTRLYLDQGETALMNALFDDIYIADTANPVADIKINGSDNLVTLSPTDTGFFTVSFNAKDNSGGHNMDWWLATSTNAGWLSFVPTQNGFAWEPGLTRCVAMPLASFPEVVIPLPPLFTGDITIYFGADNNADNQMDATWSDSIDIQVQ